MTADYTANFDWNDDEGVIIPVQAAVAVYENQRGDIVIRQQRAWDKDSDTLIFIRPENALAIVHAILQAAGNPHIDHQRAIADFNSFEARTKDHTAAERQRRCRDRKRDVTFSDRDIDRDIPSPPLLTAAE